MVIIINGTKNVGKTAVANALCGKFPDALVLPTAKADDDFTQAALRFIELKRKDGALVFITDTVFVDPQELKEFSQKTNDFCFSFYLNAPLSAYRSDAEAVEIANRQAPHCQGEFLGMLTDIDGLNAEAIAEHIARTIDQQIGC